MHQIIPHLVRCFIIFSAVSAACYQPHTANGAPWFYSTDASTDELLLIDGTSGQVSVVGSLGIDVTAVDLTILGDELYGVDTEFGVDAQLLRIDRFTGLAAKIGDDLHVGGTPVLNAEGLTSRNGTLFVSFETSTTFNSNQLGELDFDGSIINVRSIPVDMDGLGVDSNGQIYAVDSETAPIDMNLLYTVEPTTRLGSNSRLAGERPLGDLDFAADDLYAIGGSSFVRLDPSNANVLESITLSRTGGYGGLAFVPEPSSMVLAAAFSLIASCCVRSRF